MFSLQGRVALVTGSSTGLGKTIALELGKAGATVAMNYFHNDARAQSALADFRDAGYKGEMFQANVTDPVDVTRLYEEIREKLGPVDILVCNATPDQPQKTIEDYDWDFYQSMLDFFIKSPYLLSLTCLPHMKQQKWGRIINITSEVFQQGVSPFTAYVAAKGGQTGFSRSLARELAPHQITVNMVAPGWIPVERHDNDPQELKDGYFANIPMQRWGVPADIGAAVCFYASEEAGFITGQTVSVNGGMTVN